MANYGAPLLQATCSTAYKSAGVIYASTAVQARRVQVYELEFGQNGALASTDCQVQWDVSRFSVTNLLTGTLVAPNPLDIGDSSPLAQFQNAVLSELTYTTAGNGLSIKNWSINQRGSYRWRALDDGDNIVIPATNFSGIGIRGLSLQYAATLVGNIAFVER